MYSCIISIVLLFVHPQLKLAFAFFLPKTVIKLCNTNKESGDTFAIADPSLKHARKSAGIKNYETLYFMNPFATHPNFAPVISVRFPPPVSRRQFQSLKQLYGRWSPTCPSQVRYNRTRAETDGYDILDFLPPLLQATWGCRFQPEDEYGPAPLNYQCFGFLLDVLSMGAKEQSLIESILTFSRPRKWFKSTFNHIRGKQPPTKPLLISTPDCRSVFEAILEKTDLISEGFNAANSYGEDDGIQPGDIILIFHDNSQLFLKYNVWLDHVAMYIDEGLLFEKCGGGEGATFRLIDYDTFEKSWSTPPGVFRMQVRRPNARRPIKVLSDLTLKGRFSLPTVRAFVDQADPSHLPGSPNQLCGSFEKASGRILYTKVLSIKEGVEFDKKTKRAALPEKTFKPLLEEPGSAMWLHESRQETYR